MPIEVLYTESKPYPFKHCPLCKRDFIPFMRGQVQRMKRKFIFGRKQPYCAIICKYCKEIVGWEW